MIRGVLIGLLVGFGAGWMVFVQPPVNEKRSPPINTATPAEAPVRELPASTGPDGWRPPEPMEGELTVTNGHVFIDGTLVSPRPIADLRRTLAWARVNRDWGNFHRAIMELGVTGTPEAQALLVEIMGDETLDLSMVDLGEDFFRFLKESTCPGILEAARARAAIVLTDRPDRVGRTPGLLGAGWLSLVAAHAGEEELDWLEALGEERGGRVAINLALAEGARNPLAAARLSRRVVKRQGWLIRRMMTTFAVENPEIAFRAAVDALPSVTGRDRWTVLRMLCDATTEPTLDEAAHVLCGLTSPIERVHAVRFADRFHQRGWDVTNVQPLLDDLVTILEQAVSGEKDRSDAADFELVMSAIATVRLAGIAQNARTLASIRALARTSYSQASHVLESAEDRARRKQGWQPER